MPTNAELLADLLDGELDVADVPDDLAELASLAGAVREHVVLVPPTPAFREALREQVVQSAGSAAGGAAGLTGGAGGAGGAGAASTFGGGLSTVVAAVAATAVLATGGASLSATAVPGDALYGAKRGVETVQLLVADDERDVELLADFAVERLQEAMDILDTATVMDLLEESNELFDRALALAVAQGLEVEDLIDRQVGALFTLGSRIDDPLLQARIDQLLLDLGFDPRAAAPEVQEPRIPAPSDALDPDDRPDGGSTGGDTTDATDITDRTGGADDTGGTGVVDDVTDAVDDAVDDTTDAVDDAVDDTTDAVNDVVDNTGNVVDDTADAVDDVVDDAVTGTKKAVDDAASEAGGLLGN